MQNLSRGRYEKGVDTTLVKVYNVIANGIVTIDLGVQYKINYVQSPNSKKKKKSALAMMKPMMK